MDLDLDTATSHITQVLLTNQTIAEDSVEVRFSGTSLYKSKFKTELHFSNTLRTGSSDGGQTDVQMKQDYL